MTDECIKKGQEKRTNGLKRKEGWSGNLIFTTCPSKEMKYMTACHHNSPLELVPERPELTAVEFEFKFVDSFFT